ncbi:MAG: hypothetical protein ACXABY_31050, partial [Candidatus Thorarchaeota archaeon]
MTIDSLEIFDSWEPIRKARKAKGLQNWGRLQHIAHKLEGKKQGDISFTTAYPGKEGQTKVLGSVEGNLHFLLGYGNPGFHMAAYHWQIIDPNIDDEAAEELHRVKGHPSRPELWKAAEMDDKPEGDLELGMPHPSAITAQKLAQRESEGIRVSSGAGVYLAVPSEGLVYGEHNGHVYKWDVVKDSFMAATNPKLVEAMEQEEETTEKSYGPEIPDMVRHRVVSAPQEDEVYDLVKSAFPTSGSIIPLESDLGDTVYGVMGPSSLDFYTNTGELAYIKVFDRLYKSFDLVKNGNIHPSILFNFAVHYLGLEKSLLEEAAVSQATPIQTVVEGQPTQGFTSIDLESLDKFKKSVVVEDGTYRRVLG